MSKSLAHVCIIQGLHEVRVLQTWLNSKPVLTAGGRGSQGQVCQLEGVSSGLATASSSSSSIDASSATESATAAAANSPALGIITLKKFMAPLSSAIAICQQESTYTSGNFSVIYTDTITTDRQSSQVNSVIVDIIMQ
jgi:hypothetical protein